MKPKAGLAENLRHLDSGTAKLALRQVRPLFHPEKGPDNLAPIRVRIPGGARRLLVHLRRCAAGVDSIPRRSYGFN